MDNWLDGQIGEVVWRGMSTCMDSSEHTSLETLKDVYTRFGALFFLFPPFSESFSVLFLHSKSQS